MQISFKSIGFLVVAATLFVACTKEKSVEKSEVVNDTPATWSFNESSGSYAGSIDTAYTQDVASLQVLTLEGSSADAGHQLVLVLSGAELKAGDYLSPQASLFFLEDGAIKFESDDSISEFKITILQIDEISVSGSFSGPVLDSTGNITEITSGTFSARL